MNQEINFWQVRDLGDTINATFSFVKSHAANLIGVILYTAGPFLVVSAIMSVWFQSNLTIPSVEDQMDNPLAVFSMYTDPRFYLAMIAGMVGSFVLYGAMYSYVMIARDGIEPTVDNVWERIREDFGIYLTTFLLIIGLYVVAIALMIIVCVGWVVLLVGGLYLVTIMQIYLPARLHERIGAIEGIKRSHRLNKGYFTDSFLLLVVLIVISIALAMVFLIPTMAISFIYGLNSLAGNASTPLWAIVVSTLAQMCASFLSIVPVTATVLHYCNLVERTESPGLSDRVDDWAGQQPDD
ncbi:MAG: hypothetical protein HKN13_02045 [Rhodothermales bacterium]|nr:hypothetical protein [Rhodothermales bacterium]